MFTVLHTALAADRETKPSEKNIEFIKWRLKSQLYYLQFYDLELAT